MARNAHAVRQDFRLMAAADKRQVRLVTLHTLASSFVPALVGDFLRAQARPAVVEVVPHVQGVDAHFDALSSGLAHLLVAYARGGSDGALDSFDERLIGEDAIVPVVSRPFAQARGLPDLAHGAERVPLIGYPEFTFSRHLVAPLLAPLEDRLTTIIEAPLGETQRAFVLQDLGVAWVPRSSVAGDLAAGRLVELPGDAFKRPVQIRAWRLKTLQHRLARQFFDALPDLA